MIESIPFTYLLKHIPTNKYYYGVRYRKGCHPKDLWKTYFTSSKKVKSLIKKYGKKSFIFEIRKTFKTQEQYDELVSLKWEINSISNQIESISTDEDKNQRQVAFDMGVLHVRTEKLYSDLETITNDIDPIEPYTWGDDDDDDDNN